MPPQIFGEVGEQIVEAAVLEVDHDHVLDVRLQLGVERGRPGGGALRRSGCGLRSARQAAGDPGRGGGLEDAAAPRAGGLGVTAVFAIVAMVVVLHYCSCVR